MEFYVLADLFLRIEGQLAVVERQLKAVRTAESDERASACTRR